MKLIRSDILQKRVKEWRGNEPSRNDREQ